MQTPSLMLNLRVATKADLDTLAVLFSAAIAHAAPPLYTAEQVHAWATAPLDSSKFRAFILEPLTLVAEDQSGITGFAGLEPDGHVQSLYVRHDRMRQGIASRLLGELLTIATERGMSQLYTEASLLSRAVFERFGFRVEAVERVHRSGVEFERFRMVRP